MEPEPDMPYGAINHPGYQKHAQAQLAAQTQVAGYATNTGAIAPPQPSFFDQVSQRIQSLGSLAGETNSELAMLGDRVFGGSPANGAQGSKAAPAGAGHAGSVLEAFDMLLGAAQESLVRARALNSRL